MIHGHKPNGYIRFMDRTGKSVEGETRQCVHCQRMWIYSPGSGTERGWCLNCGGFICAQSDCYAQQKKWLEEYLAATSKVRTCMPFQEWNNRRRDAIEKRLPLDPALTVADSGLIVPRRLT